MFSRTHYHLEILQFLSNVINYNDIFLPKCNYKPKHRILMIF